MRICSDVYGAVQSEYLTTELHGEKEDFHIKTPCFSAYFVVEFYNLTVTADITIFNA